MEKYCESQIERVDERLNTQDKRLDAHGKELDIIKLDIMAQKKDTVHLQDAIKSLKASIDMLIAELSGLKYKPMEKYEKIGMTILTLVIGYLFGKLFK